MNKNIFYDSTIIKVMNQPRKLNILVRYVTVFKIDNYEIYYRIFDDSNRIFYVLRDKNINPCITIQNGEYQLDYAKLPGIEANMKILECRMLHIDDPLYSIIEKGIGYLLLNSKKNYIYRI